MPEELARIRNSSRPHEDGCVLLPAESLGRHALIRHGNIGAYATPLGDAWVYAQSAIALQDPDYLAGSRKLLRRLQGSSRWPSAVKARGELLGIYLPSFELRAQRQEVSDFTTIRRELGRLLCARITDQGHPKDDSDQNRGHVGELVTLGIVDQSYPSSPREESSQHTKLNHDCYLWDGARKTPISVKYRGGYPNPDRRVYKLELGPYLFGRVTRRDHAALTSDNEELAWPDSRINEEAAVALVTLALVHESEKNASADEKKLLASVRSDISKRVAAHGRNHLLPSLKKVPV